MANNKAQGPSGITSNTLKAMIWTKENPDDDTQNNDANYLVNVLHAMIIDYWSGTLDFKSWDTGTLVPAPKKDDLSNTNQWQLVY
eukprot:6934176-Ditylum_brightwellii.AAC.1